MKMRAIHRLGQELGPLSAVASFAGAFALLGVVLLGDGPEVPTGAVPAGTNTGTPHEGSDPSVPSASSVFGNRTEEPSPQIETF